MIYNIIMSKCNRLEEISQTAVVQVIHFHYSLIHKLVFFNYSVTLHPAVLHSIALINLCNSGPISCCEELEQNAFLQNVRDKTVQLNLSETNTEPRSQYSAVIVYFIVNQVSVNGEDRLEHCRNIEENTVTSSIYQSLKHAVRHDVMYHATGAGKNQKLFRERNILGLFNNNQSTNEVKNNFYEAICNKLYLLNIYNPALRNK